MLLINIRKMLKELWGSNGNYKFANLGWLSWGGCDYLKKVVFHGHNLDKDKLRTNLAMFYGI